MYTYRLTVCDVKSSMEKPFIAFATQIPSYKTSSSLIPLYRAHIEKFPENKTKIKAKYILYVHIY